MNDLTKAIIYLWTRDADLPVAKETEDYVADHLRKLKKHKLQFSDQSRLAMVEKLVELI